MRLFQKAAITIIFFTTVVLLVGCPATKPQGIPDPDSPDGQPVPVARDVVVTTSDGIEIAGTFVPARGTSPAPACLLVHQLGRDRSTYADFQSRLSEAGIASLAIDIRGHGESTGDGTLDYERFSLTEWADAANDLNAGLQWLKTQEDVQSGHIGIVGASIGANLAVIAAADAVIAFDEAAPKCLVLLSPGTSYHGILPHPRARDLGQMPVLVVSAIDDRQSYPGSQSLSQAARNGTLHSLSGRAHGTDMFTDDEETADFIVDWITAQLRPGSQPVIENDNVDSNETDE